MQLYQELSWPIEKGPRCFESSQLELANGITFEVGLQQSCHLHHPYFSNREASHERVTCLQCRFNCHSSRQYLRLLRPNKQHLR